MSKTTPNLGLVKPELTDAADITAMNPNWDILDTTMVAKFVVTSENPVSANTLLENGFYRCYFADSTVNPEKYDFPCKYGSLWTLGSSSYKAQLCLDVLNNVYYFRTTSNGSTWKAWKRIITDAEQGTKGKFLGFTEDNKIGSLDLPSTKDYMFRELITEDNLKASESLKDVGTYQIYLANIDPTTYNYPNKYGLLMVERGTSYFKQTFYDMVGKVIYYRSSVDTGTTWTEWRKIYDTANKPTASDVGAARADEHQWKEYNNLSQIGITQGSETFEAIIAAMPIHSKLHYTVTSAHNSDIYPYNQGSCEIEKTSSGYVDITFIAYVGTYKGEWKSSAFYSNSTASWKISAWAQDFRADGSVKMTGDLSVEKASNPRVRLVDTTKNSIVNINNTGQSVAIAIYNDKDNTGDFRHLQIRTSAATDYPDLKNAVRLRDNIDGDYEYYDIFGTHNKPSGKYTGNGSATERTINVGGIGKLLLIDGGGFMTLVGQSQSFTFDGTKFERSQIYYQNGVLHILSSSGYFNANGYEYNYWNL